MTFALPYDVQYMHCWTSEPLTEEAFISPSMTTTSQETIQGVFMDAKIDEWKQEADIGIEFEVGESFTAPAATPILDNPIERDISLLEPQITRHSEFLGFMDSEIVMIQIALGQLTQQVENLEEERNVAELWTLHVQDQLEEARVEIHVQQNVIDEVVSYAERVDEWITSGLGRSYMSQTYGQIMCTCSWYNWFLYWLYILGCRFPQHRWIGRIYFRLGYGVYKV